MAFRDIESARSPHGHRCNWSRIPGDNPLYHPIGLSRAL